MITSTNPNNSSVSHLSPWTWAIAACFFPTGTLLALGAARILRWPKAIVFAVLSSIPPILLVSFAERLKTSKDLSASLSAMGLYFALLIYLLFVGWYQFRLGSRLNYWSGKARKAWFIAAILCLVMIALYLLAFTAAFVIIVVFHLPLNTSDLSVAPEFVSHARTALTQWFSVL